MCFNSTTSIITFSIAAISSLYLYYKGRKNNNKQDMLFSIIVMLIGLMQLIEYFLWENQTCNKINHNLSLLILVLLTLQPIIGWNYYYSLYSKTTNTSHSFIKLYSIFFICVAIYILYWLNKERLCSTPSNDSCRLHWDSYKKLSDNKIDFIIWSILYGLPVFFMLYDSHAENYKAIKKYTVRYLFLPISFIFTALYVLIKHDNIIDFIKNPMIFINYVDVWGSLWCFSAVFLGIISIMEI
jgi:hypothetical protein